MSNDIQGAAAPTGAMSSPALKADRKLIKAQKKAKKAALKLEKKRRKAQKKLAKAENRWQLAAFKQDINDWFKRRKKSGKP